MFDINMVELLTEKLVDWYEAAIKAIPNLVAAVAVFVTFIILAKIIRKVTSKALPNITQNRAAIDLLRGIIYFTVLTLGLFVALEILNLNKAVTSLLAGAGVFGLALGFAFQEIASNFVSGIFIAFMQPYRLGDVVEVDNYFGEITRISLRTTSLTTFQGLEVLIPNKAMFTKPFTNLTTTYSRRIDIEVGVSYGDDLEKVERVTKKALEKTTQRIKGMDVEVFFKEFGSSSINLSARVWIEYPGDNSFMISRHEVIMNIKKAFDENDITIPFPIRTLDFGIKGGEKLNEVWPDT